MYNTGLSLRARVGEFLQLSMIPGYFNRKGKENRTKRTSKLFNSLPTNCIYTGNLKS